MTATRELVRGASVVLGLTVPIGVVAVVADDDLSDSAWVAVPFAAIVVAVFGAGVVIGRRPHPAPALRSAAAAAVAYLAVLVVAVIRWAVDDGGASWPGIVAGAAVVVGTAAAGGAVGRRTT